MMSWKQKVVSQGNELQDKQNAAIRYLDKGSIAGGRSRVDDGSLYKIQFIIINNYIVTVTVCVIMFIKEGFFFFEKNGDFLDVTGDCICHHKCRHQRQILSPLTLVTDL